MQTLIQSFFLLLPGANALGSKLRSGRARLSRRGPVAGDGRGGGVRGKKGPEIHAPNGIEWPSFDGTADVRAGLLDGLPEGLIGAPASPIEGRSPRHVPIV
jgi:hypothetical protein